MRPIVRPLFCIALGGLSPVPGEHDAITSVIHAFASHRLVAIGETHGLRQEADFILSLIRDPRFVRTVHDIVVEFGNSRYQAVVDSFTAGQPVPDSVVSRAWRNTTQIFAWDSPIYERFFRAVREVNAGRSDGRRLRVLLGDPPIDWSADPDSVTWERYIGQRGNSYIGVVEREVLQRGHTALLIAGTFHLLHHAGFPAPNDGTEVRELEQRHGLRVFVVIPHTGFGRRNSALERRLAPLRIPTVVSLRTGWIGRLSPALILGARGYEDNGHAVNAFDRMKLSQVADAYLYLGPRATLQRARIPDDFYARNPSYLAELRRRYHVMFGQTLDTARPIGRPSDRYFPD